MKQLPSPQTIAALPDLSGADLVLIRGAQGAGKSTLAQYLSDTHGYLRLEPDDFYHAGPFYFWDAAWKATAHAWNRWRVKRALEAGQKVVVAETMYLRQHAIKYLTMTPHVVVLRATGEFDNVHAVPDDVVENVRASMEPLACEVVLP